LAPAFLYRIVFTFGAPSTLTRTLPLISSRKHSTYLPRLWTFKPSLSRTTPEATTIEVFWRFWSRCPQLLPNDHYVQSPSFASRITFAYNTALHKSIRGVTPFEMYYGSPAPSSWMSLPSMTTKGSNSLPDPLRQ
jgi:hypothetical protein